MRSSTSCVVARLPADSSTKTRSGRSEDVELAVRPDVVDACVGAVSAEEDEAVYEAQREAVGHGRSSLVAPGPPAGR